MSALFALSANNSNVRFILLAYIPAIVFWGLDGYFLSLERVYRIHYERVRSRDPENIDFSMDTSDIQGGFNEWVSATISKTLIPFHGALGGTAINFFGETTISDISLHCPLRTPI